MFKPKDQIVHIPPHVNNDINHPDVEFGFVFSTQDNACFCRFWRKGEIGILRTTNCSELVHNDFLRKYDCYDQKKVNITYHGIKAFDKL